MRLASHEIKKIELSAKCTDELICKLASGKAEWSMSIPPQEYDTDMQLIREVREHIPNLIKHISVVEAENKNLREVVVSADAMALHFDRFHQSLPLTPLYYSIMRFNKARQALGEVEK